jgi:N-acetylmuramoyl-L-alanine amidase
MELKLIPFNVFAAGKASDYLIALDDGHGINTAGKRTPYISSFGRAIHENEFNRAKVAYLDAELKRCGFRTLLVAPTDSDTSLKARTDLANSKKADLYLSEHYDALDGKFDGAGKDPEGFTVFVYNGHLNKDAGRLAKLVSKNLANGTPQKNRGVKEANLHVLRETDMTAILTENGFMDNEREARLMVDKSFQKECAIETAKAVCEYFKVPYVPEKTASTATQKPAPVTDPDKLFRVQCGAFSKKDGAETLQKSLKAKGFDTVIVKEGAYYKVQCGAFSKRDNAETLSKKLLAKGFTNFIK